MLNAGKNPREERINALCDIETAKGRFRTVSQAASEWFNVRLIPRGPRQPARLLARLSQAHGAITA